MSIGKEKIMIQVVLRSSEAIKLVMDYYFSEKNFKISLSDGATLTLENEDTSIAFEVFKMLLDYNLMNSDNVEFINLNPNSTSVKAKTSPKGGTKGVQSKKVKKAKESKEKNSVEPTIKEKILEYLCKIYPEKLSLSEIANRLNLKYTSATSAINRLYNAGEVLKDKKHYYAKPKSDEEQSEATEAPIITETSGTDEKSSEETSEIANKESEEGVEETSQKLEKASVPAEETQKEDFTTEESKDAQRAEEPKEVLVKPEDESKVGTASVETQKEVEETLPEYSFVEKAETIKKLFADEKNAEVINYIFFLRKRNFSVEDARKKFPSPNGEILSNVIKVLFEKGIIVLDERIRSTVRYIIPPMWRIYANLLKNEVPMEEGALRTAAELGVKEFQNLIQEALKEGIVEKTVEKRVTRYAIIADVTEKEAE